MVSDVIARAHGQNRVIDFRDALEPALPEEYATMHQLGGRKNANSYPSVIRIFICDFSRGKGEHSVTVSANIEPSLCYEWLEVCKANLGQVVLPFYEKDPQNGKRGGGQMVPNALHGIREELSAVHRMTGAFSALLSCGIYTTRDLVLGKVIRASQDFYSGVGAKLKTIREREKQLAEASRANRDVTLKVARGIDYTFFQDKVNSYKKGKDGYAPVSRLMVVRSSFRKDGDAAMYPWTVKITTGEAVVAVDANGATTFRANTLRNSNEAYIKLSDRDFFRMMIRVTHFIDVWETAICIPVISNGIAQKLAERDAMYAELEGEENGNASE